MDVDGPGRHHLLTLLTQLVEHLEVTLPDLDGRVRDGILVVHTSSAAWAFELGHLEATIRERLGAHAPAQLKFVVGPLPEAAVDPDDLRRPALPQPTTEHIAEAARLSAGIADPDLREQVAKAIQLSLARARSDRPF